MDSSTSRATYMETVPVPRLPPEVTDKIIENVDWEDLPRCALVCTQWLPASRYQLFCDMRVGLPSNYERLVANVLHSERMNEQLSFVRNLLIWYRRKPEHAVQEHKSDPRVSFFHIFVGHLPNLTVLVLRHLDWDRCPPHPSMPLSILFFASISIVELRDCNFPSFSLLRRTLTALPSLASLTMDQGSWPQPSETLLGYPLTHGATRLSRPKLHTLYLYWNPGPADRCRAKQFLCWLAMTATPSTIRKLHMMVRHPHVEGHGFLDVFGPALPRFTPCLSYLGISILSSHDGSCLVVPRSL